MTRTVFTTHDHHPPPNDHELTRSHSLSLRRNRQILLTKIRDEIWRRCVLPPTVWQMRAGSVVSSSLAKDDPRDDQVTLPDQNRPRPRRQRNHVCSARALENFWKLSHTQHPRTPWPPGGPRAREKSGDFPMQFSTNTQHKGKRRERSFRWRERAGENLLTEMHFCRKMRKREREGDNSQQQQQQLCCDKFHGTEKGWWKSRRIIGNFTVTVEWGRVKIHGWFTVMRLVWFKLAKYLVIFFFYFCSKIISDLGIQNNYWLLITLVLNVPTCTNSSCNTKTIQVCLNLWYNFQKNDYFYSLSLNFL